MRNLGGPRRTMNRFAWEKQINDKALKILMDDFPNLQGVTDLMTKLSEILKSCDDPKGVIINRPSSMVEHFRRHPGCQEKVKALK